ncbi:MAG: type II toxin-antitoxin system prevent-host-death family antitoxin [Geminicoccaceae bacterium]|nr:type II toxin-antitoxin system prevent-host-death family antitoxin [Geminicoccaceae bacterium]
MSDVGIRQAKEHLSALVDRVEKGERLTLTRRGKPVARLVPIEAPRESEAEMTERIMQWSARIAAMPDVDPRSPDEIIGYDETGVPQ